MENWQKNKSHIIHELLGIRDYVKIVNDNRFLEQKINKLILKIKQLKD